MKAFMTDIPKLITFISERKVSLKDVYDNISFEEFITDIKLKNNTRLNIHKDKVIAISNEERFLVSKEEINQTTFHYTFSSAEKELEKFVKKNINYLKRISY